MFVNIKSYKKKDFKPKQKLDLDLEAVLKDGASSILATNILWLKS